MAFLVVSDSSGEMEAVVFPAVYKKYSSLLGEGNFAIIEGKLEKREEKIQFIIQQAFDIDEWLQKQSAKYSVLYLKITKEKEDEQSLKELNRLLKDNKGETSVVLFYDSSRKTVKLSGQNNVSPNASLLASLSDFLGPKNVVLKE